MFALSKKQKQILSLYPDVVVSTKLPKGVMEKLFKTTPTPRAISYVDNFLALNYVR